MPTWTEETKRRALKVRRKNETLNLVGERFRVTNEPDLPHAGHLLAILHAVRPGYRWTAECSCGDRVDVHTDWLRRHANPVRMALQPAYLRIEPLVLVGETTEALRELYSILRREGWLTVEPPVRMTPPDWYLRMMTRSAVGIYIAESPRFDEDFETLRAESPDQWPFNRERRP